MPKAIWNEAILVDSDDTVIVDGDVYFPLESVNSNFLKKSSSTSISPQKGKAFFYDVVVDDKIKEYGELKNRIAFWKGVELYRDS